MLILILTFLYESYLVDCSRKREVEAKADSSKAGCVVDQQLRNNVE